MVALFWSEVCRRLAWKNNASPGSISTYTCLHLRSIATVKIKIKNDQPASYSCWDLCDRATVLLVDVKEQVHYMASSSHIRAESVFLNVYGAPELIPRNKFRHPICSLAGRYDNPVPPRFLALIDF
jgi:hypothetical protein